MCIDELMLWSGGHGYLFVNRLENSFFVAAFSFGRFKC